MNDYFEFKNYLEHAFTQKDKAEYYKKTGTEKVYNSASSFNKDEVRKKMLDFISQFNNNEQAIKNLWKTNTDPGVIINQIDKDAWKHSKGAASSVISNELKKRYDRRHDVIRNMLAYAKSISGTTSGSGVFTSDELSTINQLDNAFHNNVIVEGTARKLMVKLQAALTKKSSAGMPSNIKHGDLEHTSMEGAPSRLRSKMQDAIYNKTGYQSKATPEHISRFNMPADYLEIRKNFLSHAMPKGYSGMPSDIRTAGPKGMRQKANERLVNHTPGVSRIAKAYRAVLDLAKRYKSGKISYDQAKSLTRGLEPIMSSSVNVSQATIDNFDNNIKDTNDALRAMGITDDDQKLMNWFLAKMHDPNINLSRGSRAGMPSNIRKRK